MGTLAKEKGPYGSFPLFCLRLSKGPVVVLIKSCVGASVSGYENLRWEQKQMGHSYNISIYTYINICVLGFLSLCKVV